MKKNLLIISIVIALFSILYVLFYNRKAEPLYPSNKNIVNSFFELSDSTSSELIPSYEALNNKFSKVMINFGYPIKSILKRVHIDTSNYNIELVAIYTKDNGYGAKTFRLEKKSILTDSIYLDKPVVDYFTFNEYCNYRYIKIKSKTPKILNDYCFMNIDKGDYSFLNIKEDSTGEDLSKIRDKCNGFWIDNHVKYFNNLFTKSNL